MVYEDVPVRIFSDSIGNNARLTVVGPVTGRNVEVTGNVDIRALNVTDGEIHVGTWNEGTNVIIGANPVMLVGEGEKFVCITADAGAQIDLSSNPAFKVSVNNYSFDPHLFFVDGEQPHYQVFVNATTGEGLEYKLTEYTPADGEKELSFRRVFFDVNGVDVEISGELPVKTHLEPVDMITYLSGKEYFLEVKVDGITIKYWLPIR